jgi:spermidine synthase
VASQHPPAARRLTPGGVALAVAVFLSGAVLLGMEITASRVLAPAFGTSLFVWGALIGVVLTGLAIGYAVGGVVADRLPSDLLLVGAMAFGAGLVLLIPVVDGAVIDWIVGWDPGPRADPLIAAIVLFGPASVVLASISPIAVKLAARSVDTLGTVAGRLFALSTAGSIFGTFVTAFWLVPEIGTDQVLAVGPVALLSAAAVVTLANRRRVATLVALPAIALAALALVSLAPEQGGTLTAESTRNWSPVYRAAEKRAPRNLDPKTLPGFADLTIREARDTRYHRMVVGDDGDSRYLRFDSSFQSGMLLDDPFATRFLYSDYLHLGLAYTPTAKDVLFIGLGGASAPKRMWRDFPEIAIQTVEIDPDVVASAYRWFAMPRSPRLKVAVEDGRRFLAKDTRRWDVIAIDTFYADAIPFHLFTREFVELVHERLAPGGTIVINLIGSLTGDSSRLVRSIVRTYRQVFPSVILHPVYENDLDKAPEALRNIMLIATDKPLPRVDFLEQRWNELKTTHVRAPDLLNAIRDRWETDIPVNDVPVLTDDYAPTDALLSN